MRLSVTSVIAQWAMQTSSGLSSLSFEAQDRHQLIQELAAGVNSRGRTHR